MIMKMNNHIDDVIEDRLSNSIYFDQNIRKMYDDLFVIKINSINNYNSLFQKWQEI